MQRGWKRSAHITIASGSSGIGFSVTEIAGLVMRSARSAPRSAPKGLSFILERGHENNTEVKHHFQEVRHQHKLEGVLGSVSFHAKQDSHAIQLADLFAYYSRRNVTNRAQDKNGMEPILEIICRSLRHHDFLVRDVSD